MKPAIAVITSLITAITLAASDTHFRKANWGDTPDAVKKTETLKAIPGASTAKEIPYMGERLSALDALVVYHFQNNSLVAGSYLFTQDHLTENTYIIDFEKIEKLLHTRYGDPDSAAKIWRDDTFKTDPSQWGLALLLGGLIYQSEWITDDTQILHQLYASDRKITHTIRYDHRASLKQRQAQQRATDLDKL